MKMDSDALKFSPQVMALAMPGESGFKAAAEGISNVGKVFNEAQEREKKEKLFDLQVKGAEQGLQKGDLDLQLAQKQVNDYDTDKALSRRIQTTQAESGEIDLGVKKDNKAESDLTKQMMNAVTSSSKSCTGRSTLP